LTSISEDENVIQVVLPKTSPRRLTKVKIPLRHRIVTGLICVSLVAIPSTAKADSLTNAAIGVGVAIGAVGIGIGFGLYYAIHASNNLSGCAVGAPDGLELRQKDNPQVWRLLGDTGAIKPGERIRVVGKRKKKSTGATRNFIVEKLAKDYGPCS
jgi:hypothetical protein